MDACAKVSLTVALAILASCATTPTGYPKAPSFALEDTRTTELGRRVVADRAERSIDAQYFIAEGDLVGTLFTDRLLAAADRGVRVRLLIDDQYTIGDDAAIDSHPNLEIRVFVSPWPFSRFRSQTVKHRFPSGVRGFEVTRERGCSRVPDGPESGLPQIAARLDPGELRRLDQRVEERRDPGAPLGPAPVVILPADRDTTQRPLDPVRVQWDLRVLEEPHEAWPEATRVPDGLAQSGAW
jgi:hypothetical protein